MSDTLNPNQDPTHADDLQGPLRRAVEHIRSQPAPQEAMTRSLDRAASRNAMPAPRWHWRTGLIIGAQVAALVMMGILLFNGTQEKSQREPGVFAKKEGGHGSDQDNKKDQAFKAFDSTGLDIDGTPENDKSRKEIKSLEDELRKQSTSLEGYTETLDRLKGKDDSKPLLTPNPGSTKSRSEATAEDLPHIGHVTGGRPDIQKGTGGGRDDPRGGKPLPTGGVAGLPFGGDSKDCLPSSSQHYLEHEPVYFPPAMAIIVRNGTRNDEVETILKRIESEKRLGVLDPEDKEKSKEKKLGAKEGDKGKSTKPRVWHRNAGRPTFARVYVGDQNSLELVSLQVTVTVEGPRARTVVDHIFKNPHAQQLEGTFEYPLPAGASPSYFAMFLGQTRETVPPRFDPKGNPQPRQFGPEFFREQPAQVVKHVSNADWGILQEARVVNRAKGLETYEEVVRGRIDPALLEYAGGNTFNGRVFPIPAKGYNRVILAYEELLPVSKDKAVYRFPLPDCDLSEVDFNLQADSTECKDARFEPEGTKTNSDTRMMFSKAWKKKVPDGDVVFSFSPAKPQTQVISGRQNENGPMYLYARIRPELKIKQDKPFGQHAIFLLDTSLSEHPDGFAQNMKLLKKILEGDADIKSFNILAFNVGAAWVDPLGWLDNTPAGRETAFSRLDGLVLEGATDFGAALNQLAQPSFVAKKPAAPVNVFVLSDGQITWGNSEVGPMVSRFEQQCGFPTRFHCYRTGLGADNLELYQALTRRGGGIFNCFTEADLKAAALAHRHQCLQIDRVRLAGGPEASDVLVAGRKAAVFPDGELIVAAKLAKAGQTNVIVEGTFQGEKWVQEYPVELNGFSELAPRGWGELAVGSLLALNDPKLDGLVTAYCQQFSIGCRVASFLVLENEADYKRFNLEDERGKTHAGDLGAFLDDAWKNLGRALSARESFARFLERIDKRVKLGEGEGADGKHVAQLLTLLKDADYELPEATVEGKLLLKRDVPGAYLAKRQADVREVSSYLMEARRRAETGDPSGAVRVLSSIIELFPTRGDALRLVGYRLLDMKQPVQAANLFRQVQQQRPFEPHSYRDLARSLEEAGKYGLAALQYEIVLAGTWHNRFHQSLKLVALEEYGHMMREAIAKKAVGQELANLFGDRLEKMDSQKMQADLRVTISWNTDNTDVDLWVIEPDDTKCFYSNRNTKNGGELTEDQTQGYGPERYQIKKALKGKYRLIVHYFRPNPNLLGGETHVSVVITRHAGTPEEVVERKTVILKKHNEEVPVGEVEF